MAGNGNCQEKVWKSGYNKRIQERSATGRTSGKKCRKCTFKTERIKSYGDG